MLGLCWGGHGKRVNGVLSHICPRCMHWKRACERRRALLISAPGPILDPYPSDDTGIRPWNEAATKPRDGGRYYRRMWRAAIDAGAGITAITSYNEWVRGLGLLRTKPTHSCEQRLGLSLGGCQGSARAVLG